MNIVADASVMVAELVRNRGRALVRDPGVHIVMTEEQWSETQHELQGRLRLFAERGRVGSEQLSLIRSDIQALIADNGIEVVPRHIYGQLEAKARRRIPRDPNDWPTVAPALALDAGILTADYDFLGCGCPTWSFETLRAELEAPP
jgi:predicted nucleic acid-binding protein